MKNIKTFILIFTLLIVCNSAFAGFNTIETKQDAHDRRSYENYNTYKNNNHQQPLGGYNRPINDDGGRRFGSSSDSNNNYGMNSFGSNNNSWNNSSNNNSWTRL